LNVRKHAINRYKQRFGNKNTSGHKVKDKIKKEIKKNTIRKYRDSKGYVIVITKKFKAVLYRNNVVTVLRRDGDGVSA